jgi:AcrR family transcriptional regulator
VARSEPLETDGRRARSERTRVAIVDSVLDLIEKGEIIPPFDKVAEIAGISRRAVFNHFRDREHLLATVAARNAERILASSPPLRTEGSLEERLAAFVANRAHRGERGANVRRAALLLIHTSPAIADGVQTMRARLRDEVLQVFEPELKACPRSARSKVLAALVAASSPFFWDDLRDGQGLRPPAAVRALKFTLGAILLRAEEERLKPVPPDVADEEMA